MAYKILAKSRSPFSVSFQNAGLIIALVSALTLAGALAIEHIGGIAPCPLCLDQRIAYYAAVPLGLIAYAFAAGRDWVSRALLIIIAVGLLINAGLGVYHSGVEWGWWAGPQSCSGAPGPIASNPADLLKSLSETQVVRCDKAALRIFGLSLAGYSVLLSLALCGLALIGFAARRKPS